MNPYILIIVALNNSWSNSSANSSHEHPAPAVAMQEFSSNKACLFAGNEVLRRAGNQASHLHVVCVPKGSK